MIRGTSIYLRKLTINDLSILLEWENNPLNWDVSETTEPYTESEIIDFIVEQIEANNLDQIRFMICLIDNDIPIGAIDLFAIDYLEKKGSVGVLINNQNFRRKGYASEAIKLLIDISFKSLKLKTLDCLIHKKNVASIQLFEKNDFTLIEDDFTNNTLKYLLKND